MFEFLTRRHAAPAEIPLSEVRFTREDLFVLLGGCDTGMFANGEYTIDFDQIERHGTDPWRRDMAARLSPTGLVDAEGIPSDELAEALYPLNKPGISVNDAPMPQAPGDRDRRTVSMVVFDGHASAIKSVGTRRGGFNMVPLPAGRASTPLSAVSSSRQSCVMRSGVSACFSSRTQRWGAESPPVTSHGRGIAAPIGARTLANCARSLGGLPPTPRYGARGGASSPPIIGAVGSRSPSGSQSRKRTRGTSERRTRSFS